jgi:hypothetical protein
VIFNQKEEPEFERLTDSADIAPSDFFLFENVKRQLRWDNFSSPHDTVEETPVELDGRVRKTGRFKEQ